ncbi:MAG: ribbon-helix-helix protein, CopG family [Pseudomonadota bacterium]|jgi:hypothetical protein
MAEMEIVSFKVPSELRRRLAAEARRRRTSQAAIIRDTLRAALGEAAQRRGETTCADLAADLIGCFRGGPRDLAANRRHLEQAILADQRRRTEKRRR